MKPDWFVYCIVVVSKTLAACLKNKNKKKIGGACRDVITSVKATSPIWLPLPVTTRRPMMVCKLRVLKWGSVFAARLRKQDWTCRLAGLSFRYYSTKTAPHIPGMEYQVSCVTVFSAHLYTGCSQASEPLVLEKFIRQQ